MRYDDYGVQGGAAPTRSGFKTLPDAIAFARQYPGAIVVGIYDAYGDMGVDEVWPNDQRAGGTRERRMSSPRSAKRSSGSGSGYCRICKGPHVYKHGRK